MTRTPINKVACWNCDHTFTVDPKHDVYVTGRALSFDAGEVELDIEVSIGCPECGEELFSRAIAPLIELESCDV